MKYLATHMFPFSLPRYMLRCQSGHRARPEHLSHLSHSDGDGLPAHARQPVECRAVEAGRHDDAAVARSHGRVRQHVHARRRQQSNDALRSITRMTVTSQAESQPHAALAMPRCYEVWAMLGGCMGNHGNTAQCDRASRDRRKIVAPAHRATRYLRAVQSQAGHAWKGSQRPVCVTDRPW